MKQWPWRKWLIVDFCAAFFGALAYFIGFDFFTIILELPHWLVSTQIAASFGYGLYGAIVYFSRTGQRLWFKILIVMNCVYAGFCGIMSVRTFAEGSQAGALLLAVEAFLIFVLVKMELSSLQLKSAHA